jgi:hypothetical protein
MGGLLGLIYIGLSKCSLNRDGESLKQYMGTLLNSMGLYILIFILSVFPAIMVARECNPYNKTLWTMIAILFSEIYLFFWALKKFAFRIDDYCMTDHLNRELRERYDYNHHR